jgi:protein gp37
MGKDSNIEWTHHTFNPWIGCVKVSDGCKNCYAEAQNKRWGKDLWGATKPRQITSEAYWKQPHIWNAEAEQAGARRRVFCASMADVFEDYGSTTLTGDAIEETRVDLWRLIESTPALDWLLLTKRPQNIMHMIPTEWRDGLPANAWVGTSVENQKAADERIPHLLKVPASVRFLSCEPLLGEVDLSKHLEIYMHRDRVETNIDWIIVGGESGHGARPMHPQWARRLREQCEVACVSFFFKQWGEWFPRDEWEHNPELVLPDDATAYTNGHNTIVFIDAGEYFPMHKVGKQKAGRLLNGQTWSQIPTPRRLLNVELPAKQETLF